MSAEKHKRNSSDKAACAAAVVTAAGAVICGICCVLPFALPAVMLAGSGTILAWFGRRQAWLTTVATLVVAAAWIWIALQSFRVKARPALATLWMMGGASVVLILAFLWPMIETHVGRLLVSK